MMLIHGSYRLFQQNIQPKFDNGFELIAKIPYPLLTPRRLCTASKVATIDYVRIILGLSFQKCSAGVPLMTERMLGLTY